MKFRINGFTLFELMVVVAILSFLVVLAYPSYVQSVQKGRRADAQALMRQFELIAARQYTVNNSYISCSNPETACAAPAGDDFYTLSVSVPDNGLSWTITATPKGGQANDSCGTLTLNSLGQMTGAKAGCWGGRGTS